MNQYPGQSYSSAAPSYFDPESVGIATFLGTPVAGAILQASNCWVAGARSGAMLSLVVGVVATGVLWAIGQAIPQAIRFLATLVALLVVFAARSIARGWIENNRIDEAVRYQQARFRSRGLVALACAPVTLVVLAGVIVGSAQGQLQARARREGVDDAYRSVSINARSEVQIGRGVTEAEARTLGEALVREQYFSTQSDHNIRVERDASGLRVAVPVVDGAAPEALNALTYIFRVAVASIEPRAVVQFSLTDTHWEPRSTHTLVPLRPVNVPDRSRLLVAPDVSDGDALVVASYLQEEQYFVVGRENLAIFERVEEVPTLAFSIARASLTNEMLRDSQVMAHRLAARLHLLRAQVQVLDESMVAYQTFVGDPQQAQPIAPSPVVPAAAPVAPTSRRHR